jgi:hypothetical protein
MISKKCVHKNEFIIACSVRAFVCVSSLGISSSLKYYHSRAHSTLLNGIVSSSSSSSVHCVTPSFTFFELFFSFAFQHVGAMRSNEIF